MKLKLCKIPAAVAAALMLLSGAACSDEADTPAEKTENSIPGKDVGIRRLQLSVPRMARFDKVVDRFSCRIHLRGRKDRVNYPVNIFLSADKDSLHIEADDPILAELPHQMYHLNAITFADKNLSARDGEVKEDTIYIGARLSIEDPDRIHFRSSFNVGANSIGAGTEADPWVIASGDDFIIRISDPLTRGETLEGKYFEITRNLNLSTASVAYGKGWEPAGHNNINGTSTDFEGTINGCDNYIENMYCYTDAGYGGLFYCLGAKAYIHNLEMKRVMLNGNSGLGAFACTSKKGCRLDSVSVNGTIEGKTDIGGLIGHGEADVRVCISSIDITSDTDGEGCIGGMIGRSESASFTDCIRTGRIDAPSASYVGGYVGKGLVDLKDNSSQSSFTRCYVSGTIAGNDNVGGFAGSGNTDFTCCHAGATLPQDSYAYTLQWDIFGVNNRMTPVPLEVRGKESYIGGFAGYAKTLVLHGENSFAYRSPAKPNITVEGNGHGAGALAGFGSYMGDDSSAFTSYAYVQGNDFVGGIVGFGYFRAGGTFVNQGNTEGDKYTGGIIGNALAFGDEPFRINCTNTGNIKGSTRVGGIIGSLDTNLEGAVIINDGSVESTLDYTGGLFGACRTINLADGSRVSTENGSLKISGRSYVGGIAGEGSAKSNRLAGKYCPVYANIIGNNYVGGLFGEVYIDGSKGDENIFGTHSPVRVSVTAQGDNSGGAIGYLLVDDARNPVISGFDDRLRASVTTAGNQSGGIIGHVANHGSGTVTIQDCHSFTSIAATATTEVSGFGGIAGWYDTYGTTAIKIARCSGHGTLSGANMTAAAGIIGYAQRLDVSACYSAASVDVIMSGGGIAGRLDRNGVIRDCFNMGEVKAGSGRQYIAGIIGQKEDRYDETVNITNCYNVGVTGWGVIGGESNSKYSISNCYYLDSASNGDMKNSGSKSKNADEMRRASTYSGWSGSVWTFHEGAAAPTLAGVPMFDTKLPLSK